MSSKIALSAVLEVSTFILVVGVFDTLRELLLKTLNEFLYVVNVK
jgi:hypothetical protein